MYQYTHNMLVPISTIPFPVPQSIVPQSIVPQSIVPQSIVPQSIVPQSMVHHSLLLAEVSNQDVSGEMQQLLHSHYIMYTLRQNLYSLVLNQSHIYKEIYATFTSITILDVFYYSVFAMTIFLFSKDLSYKRSTQKIIDNGIITRNFVRNLETFILIIVMILFQDVDNATG
jgi:hypothetical protein